MAFSFILGAWTVMAINEIGMKICHNMDGLGGRNLDSSQAVTCYLVLNLHLRDDPVF